MNDGNIEEELEVGMRIMREHMLASDVLHSGLTLEEMTEFIASMFGVLDGAADALANFAMLLRRFHDHREAVADQLDELSVMLREMVPVARDNEEE